MHDKTRIFIDTTHRAHIVANKMDDLQTSAAQQSTRAGSEVQRAEPSPVPIRTFEDVGMKVETCASTQEVSDMVES